MTASRRWILRSLFVLSLLYIASTAHRAAAEHHGTSSTTKFRVRHDTTQQKPEKPVGPHTKLAWNPRTIGALIVSCICSLLANGAGIGGGPIYLPVFMVIVGLDLTPATALTQVIVSASAVASCIYGVCSRSPTAPERSLIDWDLTVFMPALLVGVSIGVLFNVIFPRWVQTILLTALLIVVFVKTLGKGRKMWASEQKNAILMRLQTEQDNHAPDEHTEDEDEGILHDESYHLKPHKLTRRSMSIRREDGAYASLLEHEQEQGIVNHSLGPVSDAVTAGTKSARSGITGCLGRQPYGKIAAVVVLWMIFLVFQQSKSRLNRCTWAYIGLFVGEVALFGSFGVLGIWLISLQAKYYPGDLDPELQEALLETPQSSGGAPGKQTFRKLLNVAAVMTGAGLLSGLLGCGSALIFNPYLLGLGVNPQVTASTSVLLVLFSSSAIGISLAFHGFLNASYAVVFAPFGFVASIIGVTIIGSLIKRTGHASIIVFVLTALIGVGTIFTAVFGGMRNVNEIKAGGAIGFKPFCQ